MQAVIQALGAFQGAECRRRAQRRHKCSLNFRSCGVPDSERGAWPSHWAAPVCAMLRMASNKVSSV